MEQDWYELVSGNDRTLLQGDLVSACPIVVPPSAFSEGNEVSVDIERFNVVILTQSCDLDNDKAEIVLVCPVYTFQTFCSLLPAQEQNSHKAIASRFRRLKDGYEPPHHLLNKIQFSGTEDYWITDFRSVYGIHIQSLKTHIASEAQRVRLLSPYREHLAQAFARFMMRVGLPQNIPNLSQDEAKRYAAKQ